MKYTEFAKATGAILILLTAHFSSMISKSFAFNLSTCIAEYPTISKGSELFSLGRNGMNQTIVLSITAATKSYFGQGKLGVAGKIRNFPKNLAPIGSTKSVYFYLYEVGKSKEGDLIYPSVYIARYELKNLERSKLTDQKTQEFEVDLATLNWDNGMSSILAGDPLKSLPAGTYHLVMKLVLPDDEKSAKEGKKVFREYVSNQDVIEIRKHQ